MAQPPLDVEALIEPALFRWLESLGLSAIPAKCKTNPPRFAHWLVFTLLGDGTPVAAVAGSTAVERGFAYLRAVRAFLQQHEIAGVALFPHLRSIASLCDPKAADQHEDGVTLLNALIQLLQDYLTPTIAFQEEISRALLEREQECEGLKHEITAVAEENAFYREKVGRIEELLASEPDEADRQAVETILNEMYEAPHPLPPKAAPRAPRDLGSLSPRATRPNLAGPQ